MKIKDCPFCGGKAYLEEVAAQPGIHCIRCEKCWAKSVFLPESKAKIIIDSWNSRVTPQTEVKDEH